MTDNVGCLSRIFTLAVCLKHTARRTQCLLNNFMFFAFDIVDKCACKLRGMQSSGVIVMWNTAEC